MPKRAVLFILALLVVAAMTLLLSVSLLPPAPVSPTPTWPLGVELPESRPRIRQ